MNLTAKDSFYLLSIIDLFRLLLHIKRTKTIEVWQLIETSEAMGLTQLSLWSSCRVKLFAFTAGFGRLRLKFDDTRAENRFRLSAKRTSPFILAGASVSRLLAAAVFASSVVMLDEPCSEVV